MEKNNTSFGKRITIRIQDVISSITPDITTLKAAGAGIFIAALLFFALTMADAWLPNGVGFGYYILSLLCYLTVAFIVACLVSWVLHLIAKTPRYFRVPLVFTVFFVLYFCRLSQQYSWLLIAVLITFPSLVFGALSYWKIHRKTNWSKKARTFTMLSLIVGCLGLAIGLYLFLYPGSPVSPIRNFKMSGRLPRSIDASDPSLPGSYAVSFLTYGSGTDKRRIIYGKEAKIKTPTVDASFLLKSWNGISGKLRTWYFGFDQTELPLNAMVWYPKNMRRPAPLVLVVHGNHLAQDWSEAGYDYLANLLASRGYIVASVDENFLNLSATDMPRGGLENENGTRGWLMLKHLELWRAWNKDPRNPFYHRIDMDRIALMGHSRGGEAMAHAALFNTLPCFPDNAEEKFNFNFHIKAYVAIAPVDGQYKPASILAPLRDINFFVIQGIHDMDMQSYGGLSIYKRIQYSSSFHGIKAGLYIEHANHGQFNSTWGRYDGSSPGINQYNMTHLMPPEQQQQIAKVYISAFLDLNLKGVSAYKPLFMDYRYGRRWLPKHIGFSQFENSSTNFIARYEEDLDLTTGSRPGISIGAEHLSVWREAQHELIWGDHISRAAYIGWDREGTDTLPGRYAFTIADSSRPPFHGQSLVFSMAASNESPLHQGKGKKEKEGKEEEKTTSKELKEVNKSLEEKKPIDFTIELTDKKGAIIRFPLSECMPLQPQVRKRLTKYAFLNANDDAESIPDFFYYNLDTLQKQHPEFDMDQLHQVRFVFDRSASGVIILDDVGFTDLIE